MYKRIFGPVNSRRLGASLGVDLVTHKICSLNCVYCECGATTILTSDRKEYFPYGEVVSELDDYFSNNPAPDYVTFSGSGEPTLNSRIGDVVRYIKSNFDVPLALLTNGTLLFDPDLRKVLYPIDLVMPSIDAATDRTFRKINRPCKGLSVEKHIRGLIDFSKEYSGEYVLEVFILPGFNDSEAELNSMKSVIEKIEPDKIQLNTMDRPGAMANLRSATYEELVRIIDDWGFDNIEIISSAVKRSVKQSYRKDVEAAVLGTIYRRPCTPEDLAEILNMKQIEILKYLSSLDDAGKIEKETRERGVFYKTRK